MIEDGRLNSCKHERCVNAHDPVLVIFVLRSPPFSEKSEAV